MKDINLHEHSSKLKVKKAKNITYIFDIIRNKYLVFQPEEMVRQLLIHHLIEKGYPKEKIQVEKGLEVNGLKRRFDIVVYDADYGPYLLVECKSHKIKIDQSTFDQIAQYNISVKAPYLLVTNGIHTYSCAIDFDNKKVDHLAEIPLYNQTKCS